MEVCAATKGVLLRRDELTHAIQNGLAYKKAGRMKGQIKDWVVLREGMPSSFEARMQELLAEHRAEHKEQMDGLKAEHKEQMDGLKAEHKEHMDGLKAEHKEQMDELGLKVSKLESVQQPGYRSLLYATSTWLSDKVVTTIVNVRKANADNAGAAWDDLMKKLKVGASDHLRTKRVSGIAWLRHVPVTRPSSSSTTDCSDVEANLPTARSVFNLSTRPEVTFRNATASLVLGHILKGLYPGTHSKPEALADQFLHLFHAFLQFGGARGSAAHPDARSLCKQWTGGNVIKACLNDFDFTDFGGTPTKLLFAHVLHPKNAWMAESQREQMFK